MPAVSRAQQAAMAIAEHAPGKLNPSNRGLLGMSQPQLHDFAATPTRGLPRYVGSYPKMPTGMATGGPVEPSSYYAQGGMTGETDVSEANPQPIMPNTPGMETQRTVGYAKGGNVKPKKAKGMAKGGVVGGADPQTEAKKPPLRGLLKKKPSRAARVQQFEEENGDEPI